MFGESESGELLGREIRLFLMKGHHYIKKVLILRHYSKIRTFCSDSTYQSVSITHVKVSATC